MLRIANSTGEVTYLNDTLNNVKFSTTAWSPDNKASPPGLPGMVHCNYAHADQGVICSSTYDGPYGHLYALR